MAPLAQAQALALALVPVQALALLKQARMFIYVANKHIYRDVSLSLSPLITLLL